MWMLNKLRQPSKIGWRSSLMIPETTKHKDLIFQMIAYLLSDEVQARYSNTGYQSVLANSKINSEFTKA
jgi:ABC-type glycerol-3-phosphate transport system substrate-binding protein